MNNIEKINQNPEIFEKSEVVISIKERNEMQKALIDECYRIREIEDRDARNKCAIEWISRYADKLDLLDPKFVSLYRNAISEDERRDVLKKIQLTLEELRERSRGSII